MSTIGTQKKAGAESKNKIVDLPLAKIVRDPEINPRAEGTSKGVVKEYEEILKPDRKAMPAPLVYHDKSSSKYYLVDGFHRVEALENLGVLSIPCEVHEGTKREALFAAAGANSTHGLRRSNADKRRCVMRLIYDPEWSLLSNPQIAKATGTTDPYVGKLRKAEGLNEAERVVTRNGKSYLQKTTQDKSAPKQIILDLGTARKVLKEAMEELKGCKDNDLAKTVLEGVRSNLDKVLKGKDPFAKPEEKKKKAA